MKTHLAQSFAIINLLLTCSAVGQATFELNNRFLPLGINAPVYDDKGVPLAGTNYLAELYGGPSPGVLMPASDGAERRIWVPFRVQGYFSGSGVFIRNVPGFGWAWLQVRAWDARLGTSYEDAAARGLGGYGESPLFYARGGIEGHLGPPPQPLIGLQSFRLRPVTPAALVHSIRLQGDQVMIDLNPGFRRYQLQQSPALGQPWQNVGPPSAATSLTNSIIGSAQFFRVIGLLEL